MCKFSSYGQNETITSFNLLVKTLLIVCILGMLLQAVPLQAVTHTPVEGEAQTVSLPAATSSVSICGLASIMCIALADRETSSLCERAAFYIPAIITRSSSRRRKIAIFTFFRLTAHRKSINYFRWSVLAKW